jgi:hypothetical protein
MRRGERGKRKGSGKGMEAWKPYRSSYIDDGFARALEHAVDMTATLVRTQDWGKAGGATSAKVVSV